MPTCTTAAETSTQTDIERVPLSTYGAQVRAYREAAGLSQEAAAALVHCVPSMICRIEHAQRRPHDAVAYRLDEVLGAGRALYGLWERTEPATRTAALPRPHQLGAAPRHMIGLDEPTHALHRLTDTLEQTDCLVLTGPAGVGKTATAKRWARQEHQRWPEGVLRTTLHSRATPHAAARSAHDVLGEFLRTLLQSRRRTMPDGLTERSTLLTDLLHDRRMLILLDDADSADQVRPFLGIPGITVLVTSRTELRGLVATDGAEHVRVEPLPPAVATKLITNWLGPRATADPASAGALARACDHNPLALRGAYLHVRSRPGVPLAQIVADLLDGDLLAELHHAVDSDPSASISTALSTSIELQPPVARTLLHRLADQPFRSLPAEDLASLLPPEHAPRSVIASLEREYLLIPTTNGYELPNLVRAWTRSQQPVTQRASAAAPTAPRQDPTSVGEAAAPH